MRQRGTAPLESPQIWSACFCGFLRQAVLLRDRKKPYWFFRSAGCAAHFLSDLSETSTVGHWRYALQRSPLGAERTRRRRESTAKGAHHRREQLSFVGLQRAVPFVGSFPHFCPHRNGAVGDTSSQSPLCLGLPSGALGPLPCSSFPQQTHFVGLCRGPHFPLGSGKTFTAPFAAPPAGQWPGGGAREWARPWPRHSPQWTAAH